VSGIAAEIISIIFGLLMIIGRKQIVAKDIKNIKRFSLLSPKPNSLWLNEKFKEWIIVFGGLLFIVTGAVGLYMMCH